MKHLSLGILGFLILTCAIWGQPATTPAPRDLTGNWVGVLKAGVQDLRIAFQFEKEILKEKSPEDKPKDEKPKEDKPKEEKPKDTKNDKEKKTDPGFKYIGKMVSIDQNGAIVPFTKVSFEGDELKLTVAFGLATFEGKFNDKNEMSGTFEQNKQKFPLTLAKVDKLPTVNRPQTPKKPFPYPTEDITFENKAAKIKLAGTLTMPKGDGPFPAVVLVTGSGPQDRDETIFGHKPFLVIADHLAKNGIACLRYDDRGIGKSGGIFSTATTPDFATDALAAVQYLRTLKRVDSTRIGICGHSEGGIIAPMVATKSRKDVAFIIMLAGTGITGEKIVLSQVADTSRLLGVPEDKIQQGLDYRKELIKVARTAKTTEEAKTQMKEAAEKFIAKLEKEEERKEFQELTKVAVDALAAPWMRWFLVNDPVETLTQVKCPVLVLNGEKDYQVKPADNLPPILGALAKGGNKQVTKVEFKDLNHLFQHCTTGAFSEYALIEETIAPEVLTQITTWIKNLP